MMALWHHILWYVDSSVSEDPTASLFMVKYEEEGSCVLLKD
jgi:hypothetical protein